MYYCEYDIDIELLQKLRSEIIYKCSEITHIKEKTTITPNYFDYEHILGYREKAIEILKPWDYFSECRVLYLVEYNYYEHPKLVEYIDMLLSGDKYKIGDTLEKIKNYSEEKFDEEKLLLSEQQKIIKILNNSKNENISETIKLLNENQEKLLAYKQKQELNKNQIPAKEYCSKVLHCITPKTIGQSTLNMSLSLKNK